MPKEGEAYKEGEAPGDSFSEQIAKLSPEQNKLVTDLVTCFNQEKK